MSKLFRVQWGTNVVASSPAEAAFLAYKEQREQSTSTASFSVTHGLDTFEDVTIAKTAPLELLTLREQSVAQLVMQGASNADIGRELDITPRTVKAHVSHIFDKFHVGNRVGLATKMLRIQNAQASQASQISQLGEVSTSAEALYVESL